jgi:hypothetical protein
MWSNGLLATLLCKRFYSEGLPTTNASGHQRNVNCPEKEDYQGRWSSYLTLLLSSELHGTQTRTGGPSFVRVKGLLAPSQATEPLSGQRLANVRRGERDWLALWPPTGPRCSGMAINEAGPGCMACRTTTSTVVVNCHFCSK